MDLTQEIEETGRLWGSLVARVAEHDAKAAVAAVEARLADLLDRRETAQAATDYANPAAALKEPANLRLVGVAYGTDHKHPLGTFAVDAPAGADELWVYHSFGNAYTPQERLIEKVAAATSVSTTFVVGHAPFVLDGGGPYTLAVYAGVKGRRAPVPVVQEFQIPEYVPPVAASGMPDPVAWAQGTIENDSLVVPILVGTPGAATALKSFRHTADPDIADTGAFMLTIDADTASALGLPNLGPADVGGVGGAASGYFTKVDIEFPGNGHRDNSVDAVVIVGFSECLIGLRYAVNRKLIVAIDTARATLSYYTASEPAASAPAAG